MGPNIDLLGSAKNTHIARSSHSRFGLSKSRNGLQIFNFYVGTTVGDFFYVVTYRRTTVDGLTEHLASLVFNFLPSMLRSREYISQKTI